MTISSNSRKAGPYSGNDVATAFAFAFKVFTTADVLVIFTSALAVESELTIGTDYTVSLNSNQDSNPGGTVTLLTPLATGTKLTLTSSVADLQPVTLTNNGGFYPRVINDALDRATIQIQQLAEKVGRALVWPISSASASLPVPEANKFIGWNATADSLANLEGVAVGDAQTVAFIQSGTGAVTRNVQDKMRGLQQNIEDFVSVSDAINSGGIFAKDEGASGDVWYHGRYMSGAKAGGVSARDLGWSPAGYMFDIRQDSADCGSEFMRALFGRTVFGGSTAKGGRVGVIGEALQYLGPTNSANNNRNYVGVIGTAHCEAGDGGTDLSAGAKGAYFGLNGIGRLEAGATNVLEVTAAELNVYCQAGSSVRYQFGASIVSFSEIHGTECDAGLEISCGQDGVYGPSPGWKNGILFTNIRGYNPLTTDAKLISAYFAGGGGLRTIAAGLDTSLFNCTSGIVLGPNLVLTDDTLALGVSGANISKIQAGNNAVAANLDLYPKGGGGVRLFDGWGGSVRLLIDPSVGVAMMPKSSCTPTNNGDLAIQATSNTSLTFKFKGADGIVRSSSLTLA